MIYYKLSEQFPNVSLFSTTRQGGASKANYASFNLSPFSGDNLAHYTKNLEFLSEKLNVSPERIIIPHQIHGTKIKKIDISYFTLSTVEQKAYLNGVDGLITNIPGVCIAVTTADCVPVFLYDSVEKVVAVIHAGWRGTCAGIVSETVHRMQSEYGSISENIYAAIGPSISANVYQVGEEVYTAFLKNGFPIEIIFTRSSKGLYLDLWKANEYLLQRCGIKHIEISGRCTFTENDLFFSARRLGIASGRMLNGAVIK